MGGTVGKNVNCWILYCMKCRQKIVIAVSPNVAEANIITSVSGLERKMFITVLESEVINSLVWYPNLTEKNQHRYFKVDSFYLQFCWQKEVGKFKTF